MRQDLEQEVSVTLARFDKAVKESCTRRQAADQNEPPQRQEPEIERGLDLADRITAEIGGEGPPADKPRCRPWDYEAFTSRLGTFTPLKWFSKPAFASPLVCARYGWVNTGRDTLSCQCCGAQLHFSEDLEANSSSSSSSSACNADGDDACASTSCSTGEMNAVVQPRLSSFSSRLKSQHHDLCPWNGNPCPEDFLQLPPMAIGDLLAEFLDRLVMLLPVMAAKALPEVLLPTSFEEHCPRGLSALAGKTRAILAQRVSHPTDASDAHFAPAAPLAAAPDMAGIFPGGRKRHRDGSDATDADAGGAAVDYRRLSAFDDETVGTAAAIAVFGWRSASPASPAEGRSSNGGVAGDGGGDDAGAIKTTQYRLCCTLCNRRLVTDNFRTLEVGQHLGASACVEAPQAAGSPEGREGESGGSGKRRRLSGGGTPLKRMDLAVEHRSFCPWAAVHPPLEGEAAAEGVVPGWRQTLEAVLSLVDPVKQVVSEPEEAEGFSEAGRGKADEALQKVQKVLGVLMRC